MQTVPEPKFIQWLRTKHLSLDPRYPDSRVLTFEASTSEARFWTVPTEPERRPYFVSTLLQLLGDWRVCYAWRHLGEWPDVVDPGRINDRVEKTILEGLALPLGTTDVVGFSRDEIDKLGTLVFSTTIFGWSVNEDLYLVPDHADAYLKTDHHNVIHATCRTATDISRWIKGMEEAAFRLPTSVPDATFRIPAWMGRSGSE